MVWEAAASTYAVYFILFSLQVARFMIDNRHPRAESYCYVRHEWLLDDKYKMGHEGLQWRSKVSSIEGVY